ncbi:ABC transporter substrate-binding protein [Ancylobacter sp. MQZ15Z-1]|uniref:ABC transporter substrate-binding protein n=1 Tax=Ancylobacter mangrovi TaxID=2972472 RepID=A0A9X2PE86_9HYPH|nr:ABC transporter substrate-binding protein [Ancylobacter mangrovi]MCS0494538.1 ABC transporter substrate-binding protein [Ancylobacter mangrovi]
MRAELPRSTVLTRRTLLATLAAGIVSVPARADTRAPRVATLDWALLETLLAIGVVPVAAAELVLFREVAVEPPVPASVIDLGLRGAPNFEALRLARPELIFNSLYYAEAEPKLSLIAPVETISVYRSGGRPFAAACEAALRLGAATGEETAARALIAGVDAELGALKDRLAQRAGRPLLVINLGDARHFRVFGRDSMFGEVLARLGFANAWQARTSYSASAPIGLEALARFPEAFVVILRPVPPDARRILPESALWNALPNVREGRVAVLDSVDPFGGLPTARRFARLLAGALERGRIGAGGVFG